MNPNQGLHDSGRETAVQLCFGFRFGVFRRGGWVSWIVTFCEALCPAPCWTIPVFRLMPVLLEITMSSCLTRSLFISALTYPENVEKPSALARSFAKASVSGSIDTAAAFLVATRSV